MFNNEFVLNKILNRSNLLEVNDPLTKCSRVAIDDFFKKIIIILACFDSWSSHHDKLWRHEMCGRKSLSNSSVFTLLPVLEVYSLKSGFAIWFLRFVCTRRKVYMRCNSQCFQAYVSRRTLPKIVWNRQPDVYRPLVRATNTHRTKLFPEAPAGRHAWFDCAAIVATGNHGRRLPGTSCRSWNVDTPPRPICLPCVPNGLIWRLPWVWPNFKWRSGSRIVAPKLDVCWNRLPSWHRFDRRRGERTTLTAVRATETARAISRRFWLVAETVLKVCHNVSEFSWANIGIWSATKRSRRIEREKQNTCDFRRWIFKR